MSKCTNCGSNVNSGEKFCQKCGSKIEHKPAPENKQKIIIGIVILSLLLCIASGLALWKHFASNDTAPAYASEDFLSSTAETTESLTYEQPFKATGTLSQLDSSGDHYYLILDQPTVFQWTIDGDIINIELQTIKVKAVPEISRYLGKKVTLSGEMVMEGAVPNEDAISVIPEVERIVTAEKDTETTTAQQPVANKNVKVGVLYVGNSRDTEGHTYVHEQGIQQMVRNLGLSEEQIIRKNDIDDTDNDAITAAIQNCIDAGCQVIFGTSYGYGDCIERMAAKYPDVLFYHYSGYKSNGKNFWNYDGKMYEASYLAGIAAGMRTKSNKIGYVAAQGDINPLVTSAVNAFALGVKSVNPNAKVHLQVTNTWYDPQREKMASLALKDKGCDVIAQYQDTAQSLIAAEQSGIWGCGFGVDMSKQAPTAYLTAPIWNWGNFYTEVVQSVINGSWRTGNYLGGLKDGAVDLAPLSKNCATGTAAAIQKARNGIINGSLQIFSGPIKDNKGNEQIKAGESPSAEQILGRMQWYVDNIVLVK